MQRRTGSPHSSCRCNRTVVPKGPLSIRSSRFSQSVVPQGTLTPRSCRRWRRTSRCIYPVVPQSPLAVRGPAEAQGLPAVGSSGLSPRSSPAMHRRRLEGSRTGRSGSNLRTDGRALELGGVAEDAGSVRRTTYSEYVELHAEASSSVPKHRVVFSIATLSTQSHGSGKRTPVSRPPFRECLWEESPTGPRGRSSGFGPEIGPPGGNRTSRLDFGRTATGKEPTSALRPAESRPEMRFRFFPGSSPAKIRPGRPSYGLETLFYCVADSNHVHVLIINTI